MTDASCSSSLKQRLSLKLSQLSHRHEQPLFIRSCANEQQQSKICSAQIIAPDSRLLKAFSCWKMFHNRCQALKTIRARKLYRIKLQFMSQMKDKTLERILVNRLIRLRIRNTALKMKTQCHKTQAIDQNYKFLAKSIEIKRKRGFIDQMCFKHRLADRLRVYSQYRLLQKAFRGLAISVRTSNLQITQKKSKYHSTLHDYESQYVENVADSLEEIRGMETKFKVFSAWKAYTLSTSQQVQNLKIARDWRERSLLRKSFRVLIQKISQKEISFIQAKTAQRFWHTRIMEKAYFGFMGTVILLQDIRLKQAQLTDRLQHWLKLRAIKLIKRRINSNRITPEMARVFRRQGLMGKVWTAWKYLAEVHYVERKSFQLSRLYHSRQLKSRYFKVLEQLLRAKRAHEQIMVGRVTSMIQTRRKIQFITAIREKNCSSTVFAGKTLKLAWRRFLGRLGKHIKTRSRNEEETQLQQRLAVIVAQRNARLRRDALTVFLAWGRFALSRLLLQYYASDLYQKSQIRKCFNLLKPGLIE